jgi:hypothetical protein
MPLVGKCAINGNSRSTFPTIGDVRAGAGAKTREENVERPPDYPSLTRTSSEPSKSPPNPTQKKNGEA